MKKKRGLSYVFQVWHMGMWMSSMGRDEIKLSVQIKTIGILYYTQSTRNMLWFRISRG